MANEFYIATVIFIIFIVMFFIYAWKKRWGEERIGTLASGNIFKDQNINPIISWQGKKRPAYNSITPERVVLNNDKTVASITFKFTHQNMSQSYYTYQFELRDIDGNFPCGTTFCVEV